MRGVLPNTCATASCPVHVGSPGRATHTCRNTTNIKLRKNPIHITNRALAKPYISTMQSLRIYETGKTVSPAVAVRYPIFTTFTSIKLASIKNTVNIIAITTNGIVNLFFISNYCSFAIINSYFYRCKVTTIICINAPFGRNSPAPHKNVPNLFAQSPHLFKILCKKPLRRNYFMIFK